MFSKSQRDDTCICMLASLCNSENLWGENPSFIVPLLNPYFHAMP